MGLVARKVHDDALALMTHLRKCVPCLLVPVALSLIAAGAFGGVLGFLGIPWVLALIIAVLLATLLVVRLKRRHPAAGCEVPAAARPSSRGGFPR